MLVALVAVVTMAAHCKPVPPPDPPTPPDPPDPTVLINETYNISSNGAVLTLTLTVSESWTASLDAPHLWCTLDKVSGPAGEAEIKATVAPNLNYESRECTITLKVGDSATGTVHIVQAQLDVLKVETADYNVEAAGGTVTPSVTANVEYDVTVSEPWLSWNDGVITVEENPEGEARTAKVTLSGSGLSCDINITQAAAELPDNPDGKVTMLQQHTAGSGIPLVLMGDAFPLETIEDGTYRATMERAAAAFFGVEPYTTFRDLFDVYIVDVVSEPYIDFTSGATTLGTWFGGGTYVNGNFDQFKKYSLKAIAESDLDNALSIIVLNRQYRAGRAFLNFVHRDAEGETAEDCARGVAYALVALGVDEEEFATLVHHEAGGHGFGKLADEYYYEGYGQIPEETVELYKSLQTLSHAYMNVDFTADPEAVLWSRYLADERYAGQDIGIFEGACSYETGAYRPSEQSIMQDNIGGYNAPGREAIYFRLHKIAYGREWEFDWEAFLEYDAANRTVAPETDPAPAPARRKKARPAAEPCPPPVIFIK